MATSSPDLYEGPLEIPYEAHVNAPDRFFTRQTPLDIGALVSHPLAEVVMGQDGTPNMSVYMRLVEDIRHDKTEIHPSISGVIKSAISIADARPTDSGRYVDWGTFNEIVAACIFAEQLLELVPVPVG